MAATTASRAWAVTRRDTAGEIDDLSTVVAIQENGCGLQGDEDGLVHFTPVCPLGD